MEDEITWKTVFRWRESPVTTLAYNRFLGVVLRSVLRAERLFPAVDVVPSSVRVAALHALRI